MTPRWILVCVLVASAVLLSAGPLPAQPVPTATAASKSAPTGDAPSGEPPAGGAPGDSSPGDSSPGDSSPAGPDASGMAAAPHGGAPSPSRNDYVSLDQTTPRQTVSGLLQAADEAEFGRASRFLDLRGLDWRHHTPAEAARQLAAVLQRRVWLQVANISDLPEGDPADGHELERIATVEVGGEEVPINLVRTRRGGQQVWLFSSETVSRIPMLAEALGTRSWILHLVPDSVEDHRFADIWVWQWMGLLIAVLIGLPVGWLVGALLIWLLRRFTARTPARWDDEVAERARGPLRFAIGWLTMGLIAMSLDFPAGVARVLEVIVTTPLILAVGWFLIRSIRVVTSLYLETVPDDEELKTRGLRTQIVIMRKLGSVAVGLVTISVALMQFDVVRSVGWSLLASAGVVGVAMGVAAQKSLGAVVAGLQLSVTQPIRLGDAVVIQGQWGVVEEITITWVRVKLWDERRLIVPVEKFLTDSYENWSRPGDGMIGVIELTVDPTAPVDLLREQLERLAQDHPAYDGRECVLQVTDLNEQRALLRARVSTSQIDQTFAMRCDIREAMMTFLQELENGRYLARRRLEKVEL